MPHVYVTGPSNMFGIFMAEPTSAWLSFLFCTKGINQNSRGLVTDLAPVLLFLQSSLKHCFPNPPSFPRTPEVSFMSTVNWPWRLVEILALALWVTSAFLSSSHHLHPKVRVEAVQEPADSWKEWWPVGRLLFFPTPIILPFPLLPFLKWLGCCSMRQIVELSALCMKWGEEGAVTARHQIDGVWKPEPGLPAAKCFSAGIPHNTLSRFLGLHPATHFCACSSPFMRKGWRGKDGGEGLCLHLLTYLQP